MSFDFVETSHCFILSTGLLCHPNETLMISNVILLFNFLPVGPNPLQGVAVPTHGAFSDAPFTLQRLIFK